MSLPAPLHRLIGRDRERAHLRGLLDRPDVRLVTVTGLGGVGKTTLALDVARDVEADFPDGVHFVPLAAVIDPSLVPGAVARVLGVVEDARRSPRDQLINALHEREALLLLDNFEHVQAAAPLVSDLLRECAGVAILVTSRMPLHLSGEHLLDLEPLPVPATTDGTTADTVLGSASVVLFLERAQAVRPGFAVTDANAADVAELCRRVDGLPLAIELIAARIAFVLPADIRAGSTRMLPWLSSGPGDAPERHQTMDAAISWSYDLLGDDARILFRRLAIFPGGFTLDLASTVWNAYRGDAATRRTGRAPTSIDLLQKLVEVRLVQTEESANGTTRYRMLQTIREFGQSGLSPADRDATCSHLVGYLAEFSVTLQSAMWGENPALWLDAVEAEHENIRFALTWIIDKPLEYERGLELCIRLWMFWKERGYVREAETWLRTLIGVTRTRPEANHAHALLLLGHAAQNLSQRSVYYEEARSMYDALQLRRYSTGALSCLAITALDQGDLEYAHRLQTECLHRFAVDGVPGDLADAHHHLGRAASWSGNHQEAILHLQEAIAIWSRDEVSDVISAAHALVELAYVIGKEGKLSKGRDMLLVARERFRIAGIMDGQVLSEFHLGINYLMAGEPATAELHFRMALQTAKRYQFRFANVVNAIDGAACCAHARDDDDRAILLHAAAIHERARWGFGIPLHLQRMFERSLSECKAGVGQERFDRLWLEGDLLPSFDAVVDRGVADAETGVGLYTNHTIMASMPSNVEPLTPAQTKVLCAIAGGLTDQQTAVQLRLSVRTVTTHVSHILRRLGVQNRTQAAVFANRWNLCASSPSLPDQ